MLCWTDAFCLTYWSVYIDLFEKGIICHDQNWQKSSWSKLAKKMKTDIMSVSCLYDKKLSLWILIVAVGKDVLRGLIKFSVSLFLFAHPGWWSREQLEFILLGGREHCLIALAYCSRAFLFNPLLSSSLSTPSVPSLSFRSLAAWYQVWLILLCKIHSNLGSYGLWSSYLFMFTRERIITCIVP